MREKNLLYKLKHPNMIQLCANYMDDEYLYFVFEHCENKTLDDLIKLCKKRMGEDLIKIYAAQLVSLLDYL